MSRSQFDGIAGGGGWADPPSSSGASTSVAASPGATTSQGFECPCHGSKYNYAGEYEAGPAPRNLDRFEVE